MDKITLGAKVGTTAGFAVATIAQVAVTVFAAKTMMFYGTSVLARAKHVLATNGKVWVPTAFHNIQK